MFVVGQKVVLNKSPSYGECPDYVKEGDTGKILFFEDDSAAVEFPRVTIGILLEDLSAVQ